MKKILLLLAVLLGNVVMSSAQNAAISIFGSATSLDGTWATAEDFAMSTTDGVIYTLEFQDFMKGEVKFRQDNAWASNWGGSAFPSGTAAFNLQKNINVPAGTFNVTFNLTTLEYSFVSPAGAPAIVKLSGSALGDNVATLDFNAETNIYSGKGITLMDGDLVITSVDGDVSTAMSGTAFPIGTATANAMMIPAKKGDYDVIFNLATGAYTFTPVTLPISLVGSATPGLWKEANSTDLMTTDGINYTLDSIVLTEGALLVIKNKSFSTKWGGAVFPMGVATLGGSDITVMPGTYSVAFNIETGDLVFTDKNLSAGNEYELTSSDFSVVNPSSNGTLELSVATDVTVYDLSGRSVAQSANTARVDVSALAKGSYIVKTSNGVAKQFSIK